MFTLHKTLTKLNIISLLNARNCITRKRLYSDALNVQTNVTKDVILFKYDEPRFFKVLNIFAICQFGFWAYLSHFAFTKLRDVPVPKNEDLPLWRRINFGDTKYRWTITVFSFAVGRYIYGVY